MKYKSLTDYIDFFENKNSVFSKAITEIFDTDEQNQNSYGDGQTVRPFHEEPQLFADVEYDYYDGYTGLLSEYTEKGKGFGSRPIFYCKGIYNPKGKCTVKYTVASKQLDSFLGAIFACFINQEIDDNRDSNFDNFDSSSKLTDEGHSIFIKILNKGVDINAIDFDKNEIEDFLLAFARSPLQHKLKICKTGIIAPVLRKLKDLDVDEADYFITTHYIKFTYGSCWSLPLDVIIKKSCEAISVYLLHEDNNSWTRRYKKIAELEQEQFDVFLEKLKSIHIENWEHNYGRYPITDATGWSYCQTGEDMPAMSSEGYMIFPDNFDDLLNLMRSIVQSL